MIELKINFKHFKLEMVIGANKPWFTKALANKEEQIETGIETPIHTHQDEEEIHIKKTHISEIAKKYQTELNTNQAFPPKDFTPPSKALDEIHNKNRSDVSSFTSDSIFLHENGLYEIGNENDDKLGTTFDDFPDVEIIDDDYETRLAKSVKLMNQRYATYKETHDID
ncbi:hypothetical protein [Romboutsia sp.]|uniref:hypothetical protein n=1 Tax=Romboutsia sp. TaxID=1965302 RepID=UPI002B814F31|nr:hypothetical protein [Romboutsia sp.]HSQ90145.1 hypothetical protein [Romboutsia sp.]